MFIISTIILSIILIGALAEISKKKENYKKLLEENNKLVECVMEEKKEPLLLPEKSSIDLLIDKIGNSKVNSIKNYYGFSYITFENNFDITREEDMKHFNLLRNGVRINLNREQMGRIAEIFNRKLVE